MRHKLFWVLVATIALTSTVHADTKTYCITGSGNGTPWSWTILEAPSTVIHVMSFSGVTGSDSDVRDGFVASINLFTNPNAAAPIGNNCFTITRTGNVTLKVGDDGDDAAQTTEVTANGVSFNPMIHLVSSVPVSAGAIAFLAALLAGTGVLILRRRAAQSGEVLS